MGRTACGRDLQFVMWFLVTPKSIEVHLQTAIVNGKPEISKYLFRYCDAKAQTNSLGVADRNGKYGFVDWALRNHSSLRDAEIQCPW